MKLKQWISAHGDLLEGRNAAGGQLGKKSAVIPATHNMLLSEDPVVWMWVDYLYGDKFFHHFYLNFLRQLGALVLSAEPALGT